MSMHRHSGHLITQVETLLQALNRQIDHLADFDPADGHIHFDCNMQHLRNLVELLAIWALGADAALRGVVPMLGRHSDSGAISQAAMEEIECTLVQHLGEVYVYAAMAAPDAG
ncbi:MAG: hypothetical protein Q4F13_06785 [Pseudomonadota bacterium]|nr:hypothetical protein [Pseudomonadota bacterium]